MNYPPAHHSAPATSHDAAHSVAPYTPNLRRRVYDYIASRGLHGATDVEVQAALQMPGNTERPRRQELERDGLVMDSGARRHTPAGRRAVVWVVRRTDGTLF